MLPSTLATASFFQTRRLRRHTAVQRSDISGKRRRAADVMAAGGTRCEVYRTSITAAAVDNIEEGETAAGPTEVVDEQRGRDFGARFRRNVRRAKNVRMAPQEAVGGQRLRLEHVERRARDMSASSAATRSASRSTRPRDTLITWAPRGSRQSASLSRIPRVAVVSGSAQMRILLRARKAGRAAVPANDVAPAIACALRVQTETAKPRRDMTSTIGTPTVPKPMTPTGNSTSNAAAAGSTALRAAVPRSAGDRGSGARPSARRTAPCERLAAGRRHAPPAHAPANPAWQGDRRLPRLRTRRSAARGIATRCPPPAGTRGIASISSAGADADRCRFAHRGRLARARRRAAARRCGGRQHETAMIDGDSALERACG